MIKNFIYKFDRLFKTVIKIEVDGPAGKAVFKLTLKPTPDEETVDKIRIEFINLVHSIIGGNNDKKA